MKKLFLITLVAVAATTAYLTFGQNTELRSRFKAYDTNQDGRLSGAEMAAAPILKKLDLDGNGELTLIEAAKALKQKTTSESRPTSESNTDRSLFDQLDKNHDGNLTEEEIPHKKWFDRFDTDSDGKITFAESSAVTSAMRERGESLPRIPTAPATPAAEIPAKSTEISEAPQILKGAEVGVAHLVEDISLTELSGGAKKLNTYMSSQGLVLAFFGATCPISGKFGPELARLEKDCAENHLRLLLICPVKTETTEDIQKFITAHALTAPVIHDHDGAISLALQATTTTEVFLIDTARTLVYRGAINDQYGLGYSKDKATKTYLRDAIAAMIKGTTPDITATTAPGCALDMKVSAKSLTGITYHQHISRILQSNCVECHRAGGVGPFSLTSYEDVIKNAAMMRKQIERGAMPPWFAAVQPSEEHTPWINDAALTSEDKSTLLTWLASDRQKGDVALAPKPRQFPEEWTLGTPDAIFELPRPVSIKAEGTMPYQFITAATNFAEDRWVQGYEILPTDKSVVHHVIVQVHKKDSKARDRGEGSEGYWAAYVPGNTHHQWPEGFAKKLPAGATLSFQIHYTPNGKKTQDQMRMGLLFAKREPRYIVHTAAVTNARLDIPPGEANHIEIKEQTIPMDMHIIAYVAHMHVRGKAFKFEVTPPGGSPEIVLDLPHYDFNWQLRYNYSVPRLMLKGSKVKITAIFDNSPGNPANPDPTKNVRWGQQTFDEMMIGYIEYYTPNTGSVALH